MNEAVASELLTDGGIDVRDLPDGFDVIGTLRQANAQRPKQAWTFYLDVEDRRAPTLSVGIDGTRGVLTWWDGSTSWRPAHGANTEPVDYWRAGHHSQVRAGHEIPADDVLSALREFLATRNRPACVEWIQS